MAEQVNGIGLNVDSGLFEVGATLPQTGSWSIGCDVTIEDVDASVQEVRVSDISLSGSLAIPEVSINIDANNDKIMDLEIGIAASGLSTGITERQIVPYDKIVKITEFSPESINERKYASSALAAKRIYDLIKEGGAGLNEDELDAFLKRYGYVTEEYVSELLKNVSSFFYLSEDGQSIGTPYNIFSEKEISANGLGVGSGGSGSGEGGGLIRTVLTSSSLGSVTSNDSFTTFNAFAIDSIYKKVKSIEEGNVSLSNYYTKSESDARFALLSSLTTIEEKIREILSWFTIDENGNLRTEFNLYSTKEISAGGFNGTGGSTGGGLISTVLGIDKFGTVTTNSNTSTFNAYAIDSLHKRIKNLEESEVDLTGYATEEWVMGRGFITASALAPYLKASDFETWKTSSFNPVVSQVNTNKNNIAEILKWFAIDGDGNLYTTYNFYSTKEISSGGFDSGSNGTGGLIGVVYGKSSFGTIATESNKATFNAYAIDSLYKRIVSLENKEVDLTGYATEAWVAGQGFITSAALSPYMKTADANDTFATKTALSNLSSSHDSLATRVSTAEGNISTNAKGIADNKTAITNLGKRVTANEGNIAEILKWFAVDADGNLYTTYNLYSTKEISANGLSVGSGGSGGGLISQVFGTTAFGTITSESNSATFNAYAIDSLYKRIVSLEGKATAVSFVPSLTSGKQIGTLSIDGVSTILYGVDAYSKAEADGTFLKLSGGTISNGNFNPLTIKGNSTYSGIGFVRGTNSAGYLVYEGGTNWTVTSENWAAGYRLIHSNNYSQYALPLSGGALLSSTIGCPLYLANTKEDWNTIGFKGKSHDTYAYLGLNKDGNFFVTTTGWGAAYTLLHSGNYSSYALPLSGGTLTGKLTTGQRIALNGSILELCESSGSGGIMLWNGVSSGDGVRNLMIYDGSSWNKAIHSGNVGSQNAGSANMLTYIGQVASSGFNANTDLAGGGFIRNYGSSSWWGSTMPSVLSYGVIYQLQGSSSGAELAGQLAWDINHRGADSTRSLWWRASDDTAFANAKWHQIAFTDSNVASATKLATARTIWGQSFDGSGNVSGTLYDVNNIYPNSAAERYIGTSSNPFKYVYAEWFGAATNSNLAFGANNAVHMVIKTSGNVLIGTTTDSGHKLDVNGSIRAYASDTSVRHLYAENSAGKASLYVAASGNRGILDATNSKWVIVTNGTNTWLDTGNVGIGTSAPEHKLHISGNAAAIATDGTPRSFRAINSNGTISLLTSTSRGVYDSTNSKWLIGTNGTNSFLLCGNVGIGTDAPAYKLDVSGTSRFTDTVTAKSLTISDTSMIAHIAFSRGSANYLYAPSGGTISFVTNGKGISGANSDLVISNGIIYPGTTGVTKLGYGDKRWSSVASVNGDFSGDVTASTFKTSSTLACGGRLRVTTNNSANSFGYLKTTAVSSALNVGLMHIGTNYGGTSDINSTAVDMTAISIYRGVVGFGKEYDYTSIRALYDNNIKMEVDGNAQIVGTITARSGIKISSGQALTFLDASGVEHKLTYDSTAGAFKFDGNILVLGDGQFNAIN